MYEKLLEEKRDMFAIDIANVTGICSHLLAERDGLIYTYSSKKVCLDGKEHVFVRVERVSSHYPGFDFAEVILPENEFYLAYGINDSELITIRKYLEKNLATLMQ